MAVNTFNFTTGPCTLPDVGILNYNGCTFSPLFQTSLSGESVSTEDGRTVKWFEVTLVADGYVTLATGQASTSPTMLTLARLLNAQGGNLVYQGRGFDIVVAPGAQSGGLSLAGPDLAWGPIPKVLEFQPLGAGRSAKVRWQVKVHLPAQTALNLAGTPLLQFNSETVVSYGEDNYSTLSIRGTMEIPLSRTPNQATRTLTKTVDDFRTQLQGRIMAGIDLSRFRVVKRDFPISRDKRVMNWDFVAEEKPYMDNPPDISVARGSYNFRPSRAGMGLVSWLCTLRATYSVRRDKPRRLAWLAFLALLRLRMNESAKGIIPDLNANAQQQNAPLPNPAGALLIGGLGPAFAVGSELVFWARILQRQNQQRAANQVQQADRNAWLIDFSGDEGTYSDSKTISFSASWKLVTEFSTILVASGIWKKLDEKDAQGRNYWATSMQDIQGPTSWLPNTLDPSLDIIVDFGAPGRVLG